MDENDFVSEIVTRIVAQCQEAVPANAALDYLGDDYANCPYWKAGETTVRTERFGSELRLNVEVTAHLYGGLTTENNRGVIEKQLRAHITPLIIYFADHLDMTSDAHPEPMDGILENGVFLNPIRKRVIEKYFVLELVFNVPVLY